MNIKIASCRILPWNLEIDVACKKSEVKDSSCKHSDVKSSAS